MKAGEAPALPPRRERRRWAVLEGGGEKHVSLVRYPEDKSNWRSYYPDYWDEVDSLALTPTKPANPQNNTQFKDKGLLKLCRVGSGAYCSRTLAFVYIVCMVLRGLVCLIMGISLLISSYLAGDWWGVMRESLTQASEGL